MTERLYQKNVYQKSCTAEVTGIREDDRGRAFLLDRTVFCPEGGGQGSDRGFAVRGDGLKLTVCDVQDVDGEPVHYYRCDEEEDFPALQTGDKLELQLDWAVRFDHMQRHAGEHILSGALHRLFGAFNHGFHMGEASMTIDAAFHPEGEETSMVNLFAYPEYQKVTWEMALQAEREANRVIWEDAPITVRYFQTKDEAEHMPLRKKLNFDEDISVVTVGDASDPYDCCPCCGTHPDTAGQVGLIKVYKVEANRGCTRIYFEAGKRALEHYDRQYDLLLSLGDRLSAGEQDISEKLDRLLEKENALHNEVYQLKQARIEAAAEELRRDMRPGMIRRFSDLSADEILRVEKKLKGAAEGVIFLVQTGEQAVFLLSDGETKNDCAAMVKELARPLGGKGGGKPGSARVRFPDADAVEMFLKQAQERLN